MTTLTNLSNSKYANFPADYRAEAIETILNWVKWGTSGVVVGGSGTGKSNIAGYLASRPDVTSGYLPEPVANYLFVYFDFNRLPRVTTSDFYRLMLRELRVAVSNSPELSQQLEKLDARIHHPEDTFSLYMTLLDAHDLIIQSAGKRIIWILDRFEKGCPQLEAETLNSLRSLRDQHKGSISFIPFARQPLSRLRNPAEYDEFHEILSMHTCFVGPMNERDGKWPAKQVEERFDVSLQPVPVGELYSLCGGLPAFLKVVYEAFASNRLTVGQSTDLWRKQIVARPDFRRFAQEIWESYQPNEQAAMRDLVLQPNEYAMPPEVEKHLLRMGILQESYNGDTVEFFSVLFADFVEQQASDEKGITFHGEEVYRDGSLVELAKLEFRLFRYLYEHEGSVCEKLELIKYVWEDDEAYDDGERLPALIRRVRARIEQGSKHQYIENIRGRGYKFIQHP